MMQTYYWISEHPHADNSETMAEYLQTKNDSIERCLSITMVDGSYAEGVDAISRKYAIHASGNGDSYTHKVEFVRLPDAHI
ncbi:MAG: hypothetical protein ACI9DM_002198 [Cyclobacteriaceae bacterium]|jgi:hypothetical protein